MWKWDSGQGNVPGSIWEAEVLNIHCSATCAFTWMTVVLHSDYQHLYSPCTAVTGDGKCWNNEWARLAVSARNQSRVKVSAGKCWDKRTKRKVPLTIKWDVELKRLLLWSGTPLYDPMIFYDLPGERVYSSAKWTYSFSSHKHFRASSIKPILLTGEKISQIRTTILIFPIEY